MNVLFSSWVSSINMASLPMQADMCTILSFLSKVRNVKHRKVRCLAVLCKHRSDDKEDFGGLSKSFQNSKHVSFLVI